MALKRNRKGFPDRLLNDANVFDPVKLPLLSAKLKIANLLPPKVDAPDWGTPDATETVEFEQFLNDHFPREKFSEFRKIVDGPNLIAMAARKQGEQIVSIANSKLSNYRYIVEMRKNFRSAARILLEIGKVFDKKFPLRICHCGVLFLAGRSDKEHHDTACGSKFRMASARERKKLPDYEYHRKLKGRPDAKRKKKKATTRRPKAA